MKDKVWVDEHLIKCYQLAQIGLGDMKIAKELGVTYKTFKSWLKKKPALSKALKEGRLALKVEGSFRDYVYNKLDYDLRILWEQLEALPGNQIEEIEALLADKGDRVRQRLFFHALVNNSFNPSEAMAKVHVTTKNLKKWLATDPEFADLMDEIHLHKKNYIEGAMFRLIEAGHPGAILFAQERINDDRGYGKKMKVEHKGDISHNHTVSVADLDLDLDTEKKLLEALRERQKAAMGYIEDAVDAEYSEVG